ncbi:MAG TPA: O-antigen ligase family protein [Candidatus Methylomirabilis sp.]|nr:O-antigen ligase family protein [Candidatus Methylomirabilis sp.]
MDNNKEKNGWWFGFIWLAALIIGVAVAAGYFDFLRLALPFIFLAAFLFLPEEYGLYALALFLPAINWNFYYHGLLIPLVDLLGLAILAAFVIRKIYDRLFRRERFSLRLPLLIPFGFFLIAAFVSCFFANYIRDSLWYFVRWILFFYSVYLVFPVNAANKETVLRRAVVCLVGGGVITAAIGLISIFFQDWTYQFVRALPLSFGGLYPLGDNHNLLAEVLVVSFIFTQALKSWTTSVASRRWLDILTIFQLLILLVTFSRAAWIAVAVQIIIWFIISARRLGRSVWVMFFVGLVVLSPLFFYMYQLQSEFSIGISSTENRLIMTDIAWDKFLDKPIFGQGTGTFINFIADDIRFIAKYGAPLDSHGVLQKIILENGLIGLFAFLAVLWSYLTVMFRALKKYRQRYQWLLPLFLGSVGIIVMELFNTSYYKGKLWLPIALCLAAVNIIRRNERKKDYAKN